MHPHLFSLWQFKCIQHLLAHSGNDGAEDIRQQDSTVVRTLSVLAVEQRMLYQSEPLLATELQIDAGRVVVTVVMNARGLGQEEAPHEGLVLVSRVPQRF